MSDPPVDPAVQDEPPWVVCDAGPIVHLDQVCQLDLLFDFPKVLIPTAVWKEVTHHRPNALIAGHKPLEQTLLNGPIRPDIRALAQLLSLGLGEIEAIHVATECPHAMLLTDDTAAHLAAQHLKLPVHGTIGVLLRAIRRRQRTPAEIVAILQSLPTACSLHIRPSFLKEIISQANAISQPFPA